MLKDRLAAIAELEEALPYNINIILETLSVPHGCSRFCE